MEETAVEEKKDDSKIKVFSRDLFITNMVCYGANSLYPIKIYAEPMRDDYGECPWVRGIKGVSGIMDGLMGEPIKLNHEGVRNLTSTFRFMNKTYESLPWFNEVRYDAEKICERILKVTLTPEMKDTKFEDNIIPYETNATKWDMALLDIMPIQHPSLLLENKNGIFALFRDRNHVERTGDQSKYEVLFRINPKELSALNELYQKNNKFILNLDLGEKVDVRKTTIDDIAD